MQKIPDLEQEILEFWKKNDIFKKSLAKESPQGNFVFFEGPPTANGKPGLHHVLARAFKDVICRYKTMQGYHVERKAGWDTHGLPVEIEVEKQLGIKGKPDIEKYGVEEFNKKCRESVWKYKEEWEKMTERIGYWLDMEHPYITYTNEYIESVWWILKQAWIKGLLYQGHKVVPYCPRCGTSLSTHEVAQGYKLVKEPSVYVKFKVTKGKGIVKPGDSIVAWTTTPWTLPGNVALAVGQAIEYMRVEVEASDAAEIKKGEVLIFAADAETQIRVLGGNLSYGPHPHESDHGWANVNFHGNGNVLFKNIATIPGDELAGIEYEPLYTIADIKKTGKKSHYVATAQFVSTDDGTGVVHTAVMYGAEDYELGLELDLPAVHMVDLQGKFLPTVEKWAGKFVKNKEVEQGIIEDLRSRGLLLAVVDYEHDYPFCWRCSTPLLYYAKDSWFVKMVALQNFLLTNADTINWYPAHIKEGRFGEWLSGVKDWAISRERYWGTPLPIWQCEKCHRYNCVGSIAELETKIEDLHRPYIDAVKLACECGGTMHRVPEVLDTWFDSGSMPFAQHHYPFENEELVDKGIAFPADYIAEAIDQTRGWFYTLLAVSTILGKGASYKNVVCLGHINDAEGKKMSKSKGNVVDPWYIADTYGIDALRYHLFTINQPGETKSFDEKNVLEVQRKVLMTLMNVVAFYKLYTKGDEPRVSSDHVLDRWIMARTQLLVKTMTEDLDKYAITEACREIGNFVDDLSLWYVRRSRDRFKDVDQVAGARSTLQSVLAIVSKVAAPFMPFIADLVWRDLDQNDESVHLTEWPVVDTSAHDEELLRHMSIVRSVVEKAHALRSSQAIKVRQPLSKLEITTDLSDELRPIIAEEVNVKEVVTVKSIAEQIGVVVDEQKTLALHTELNDELKAEGALRELVRQTNALRKQKGLMPTDSVVISYHTASDFLKNEVISKYMDQLKKQTVASEWKYIEAMPAGATKADVNGEEVQVHV